MNNSKASIATRLVSVAAVIIGVWAQAAPAAAGQLVMMVTGVYSFANVHSGKCLEIGGWSTADFAPANQWTCHGGYNQEWGLSNIVGTPHYLIINVHSGKCLEIRDWSTADFAPANQWTCHGGNNQRWTFWQVNNTTNDYLIRNVHSGKCLEIGGWSTADFAPANQWTCHEGNNQVWRRGS